MHTHTHAQSSDSLEGHKAQYSPYLLTKIILLGLKLTMKVSHAAVSTPYEISAEATLGNIAGAVPVLRIHRITALPCVPPEVHAPDLVAKGGLDWVSY